MNGSTWPCEVHNPAPQTEWTLLNTSEQRYDALQTIKTGANTMRRVVNTIVATAEPCGNLEMAGQSVQQIDEIRPDAVVILGNLASRGEPHTSSHILKALSKAQLPTFYVPGEEDGPIEGYMRGAATMETAFPYLHGVHGTFAMNASFAV